MPRLNIGITYLNKSASYLAYLGTGLTEGLLSILKGNAFGTSFTGDFI